MMHDYKYSLSNIENLLPYERTIYINMLNEKLEKEAAEKNGR